MSSDRSSNASNNTLQTIHDTTYLLHIFAIAGCVMAGLIALVILRVLVNLCIDVLILGDFDSAQRGIGSNFRRMCPWWHRRTEPEMAASSANQSQAQQNTVETFSAAFRHRSLEDRKSIVATLLPGKILSYHDMEAMKSIEDDCCDVDEECSLPSKCVCSICLVEFEIADHVVAAEKCAHLFHQQCILEWLSSHGTDCPYCRRPMVSMEILEAASNTYDS